jgi:S1-C subfamily serine protease
MENGRIVAINTMTIRGAQNTNFAISSVYACRILRLLQQGVDPSPPELTWVTFRDVDERRMLRIARNFAPAGLALEPGDVVRGVVGVMERIDNDTQLVHALRGRLDNFRLNVVRGGKEIELAGRLPPAARVMERRGILVGGVLISESRYRDGPDVGAPLLVVHHVEPGSPGQSAEIGPGDLLETVAGQPVRSLEELASAIAEQAKSRRAWSDSNNKRCNDEAIHFNYPSPHAFVACVVGTNCRLQPGRNSAASRHNYVQLSQLRPHA